VVTDTSGASTSDAARGIALSSIVVVGFELQSNTAVLTKYQDAVPGAPTADAGKDKNVTEGEVVTLDGSGSSAAGGATITTYLWEQIDGTAVKLSDTSAVKPTFTAPNVGAAGETLRFRLTVTDSNKLTDVDNIDVKVNDAPLQPAGPPATSSGGGGGGGSCFIGSMFDSFDW
jgi:hypothetical protein